MISRNIEEKQQVGLNKRRSRYGILFFIIYISAILISLFYSGYLSAHLSFGWMDFAVVKGFIMQVQIIALIGFITVAVSKQRFWIAYITNICYLGIILAFILIQKATFNGSDLLAPIGLHFIILIIQSYNHAVVKGIKALEKKNSLLYEMINYDDLTRIPNRRKIMDTLNRLCQNEVSTFSLVFIDLDNFKSINDLYGHSNGDQALIYISELISKNIHPQDMFGRLSGDEFILIIRHILKESDILQYVEHLRAVLANIILIKEYSITPSASFGISIYPFDAKEPGKLLSCADMALYHAKAIGKNNIRFFHEV